MLLLLNLLVFLLQFSVHIEPAPAAAAEAWHTLFTPGAVQFIAELISHFDEDVDEVGTLALMYSSVDGVISSLKNFH